LISRISKSCLTKVLLIVLGLYCHISNGQIEPGERVISYWGQCLYHAKHSLALNQEDYLLFCRFEESNLDKLRAQFMLGLGTNKVDTSLINTQVKEMGKQIVSLYRQFEKTEAEYPSSIDEYRKYNLHRAMSACDTSGCDNIGFENGNLSGWNAFYAYNNSFGFNSFNLTHVTGGPVGAVTQAANDTLTSTPGFYSTFSGPNNKPDYQVSIVSGTLTDALTALPEVSPYGGKYSVMLGDSTQSNTGVAILSKTFLVKPNNTDFTYQYAVVLENPSGGHTYYEQPFFQVAVVDQNGDTIPSCGKYEVVSSGGKADGFNPVYVPTTSNGLGNDTAYYKNWTVVCVPLKKYVGQCISIIFEVGDCAFTAHFGYAYVDASCAPLEILTSSPSFCGQSSITLTGPPGFTQYRWSGPPNGIKGSDTTQIIKVDSSGTYRLISIPVTGMACADTLTITIKDTTGPPPKPSFKTNTVCAGQTIQFTNTSNPLGGPGVKFYWDFYNIGTYQDSSVNPTWSFSSPGTYYVKLTEVKNGCGTDTIIPVTVIPPPYVILTAPTKVCEGDSVTLTAEVISSYNPLCFYLWNTGAITKSITVLPTAADSEYYVTVTSGCTDTSFHKLTVVNTNPIHACCDTTMPAGDTTTILAYGERSYIWNPTYGLACPTCPGTLAEPLQTTTYTVTGTDSNGCKLTDTVQVIITRCSDVFIPKAFSPNGKGLNETFFPEGKCLSSYTMYIFDRWGMLLYSSPNGIPWDGTVRGRRVQEDTYVYQIVANTWDGNQQTFVGAVTVLR
jgi:gliding motility-associated-like protein